MPTRSLDLVVTEITEYAVDSIHVVDTFLCLLLTVFHHVRDEQAKLLLLCTSL